MSTAPVPIVKDVLRRGAHHGEARLPGGCEGQAEMKYEMLQELRRATGALIVVTYRGDW